MAKEARKSPKSRAKPAKKQHRVVQRGEDAVAREAAISDILRVISSSPGDPQPVFDTILAHTLRLCEGEVDMLWQFDGEKLRFAAHRNSTVEGVAYCKAHPLELGTYNPTPQAALERRIVQVLDVFANPNYRPLIPVGTSGKRPNAGTVLAVPLVREDELFGVITIWRYEKRPFTERQIDLVKTFTAQAVIAMQNVRLFNETREALEQQTATAGILRVITSSPTDLKPVMSTVVENAARLAVADHALIGQAEGGNIRWLAAFGCPLPSAVRPITRDLPSGRAMLDLQTTQVEDVAQIARDPNVERAYRELGVRSIFATPLVREGRAVGVLLLRRTEVRPFTKKQIELLRTFADQAAIAIENVRLFNETKEALERQTATADILRVISSTPTDTRPVFEAIVQSALRMFGGMGIGIALLEAGGVISVAEAGSLAHGRGFGEIAMPLDRESASGRAIMERAVVNIPDIEAPEAPAFARARGRAAGFRAIAAAPMLRGDDAVGAIVIMRESPGLLSDKQLQLLKTFADQAVIAIENVRLFNETKESLEQQTAISEVLRIISDSPTDVKPVLDAVAARAARICEASDARIFLVEDNELRHAAGFGNVPMLIALGETAPLTRGLVMGRAVLDRAPVHVEDIAALPPEEFPLSTEWQKRSGLRTNLSVPLLRENRALGVITLRRTEVRPFSEKQIALVKTFADQAAIAIENVRLFNETREALEQQTATAEILRVISGTPTDTRPVFEAIVQSGLKVFAGAGVGIAIADHERVRVIAAGGILGPMAEKVDMPRSRESATGAAIVDRAVVNIIDTEAPDAPPYARDNGRVLGFRAIAAAPMLREGEAIGAIGVTLRNPGGLSEKQLELLKTFADQAVIAIENVRLFNETKESLERQTATSEILRVIARSPNDVQPVFDTIVRNAAALCKGMFANAFRYDGELLHFAASSITNPQARKFVADAYPMRLGKTQMSGRAVLAKSVVRMEDALSDPDYDRRHAEIGGWRRMLSVPMLRDGSPIGAIVVAWPEPGPIPEVQEHLLQTFADQAVIAVENVRLFNETKEALEQQTAISEILRVISGSPTDVQPVLDAVAERAAKICDAVDAQIFLREGDDMKHVARFGPIPIGIELGDARRLSRGWVAGRAVLEGRAIHIEDLVAVPRDEYPVSHELRDRAGHRTLLSVPLMRERRALGAISLRRMEVRPFTEKQIALLQTFADQAAIAIQNVRLFNETREALEQQKASAEVLGVISSSIADTTPVFDKILESCHRLFEGHLVGLTLVGEDRQVYLAGYFGPHQAEMARIYPMALDRNSGTGCAILDQKVVHFPDVAAEGTPPQVVRGAQTIGFKSIIFAPLIGGAGGIGALWVARAAAGAFSEKEISLLQTFANQAVIAIQNARLFREIQEKSAQLEVANKHKSDFLANMSHELRTPLNAIIGFSEALMDRMFGEVNDKQADYLKDIHESGRHLLSLINDILDLSKIEAGRMELEVSTFHLPTALANAMTLVRERAQRHSINLNLELDERLGEFQADERKFKQIMLNLLSNAVKFTPDGGRVDVCATRDTDKIEIAVKDTGIGIAPEDQAVVFEEFKQVGRDQMRKAEGTGLGLALTKRFVELHGGAIRLESKPGKGSTFTVSLPLRAG
jgi:GAF domain-containing protein/anti-sigma regulatory factor (Ser/Thr protein kinase)